MTMSDRWQWLSSVLWDDGQRVMMQEGDVCEGLPMAQEEAEKRVPGLVAAVLKYAGKGGGGEGD